MDQSELYGRVIKCNPAKPLKDASEGLGSRTAVWEQVCHLPRLSYLTRAEFEWWRVMRAVLTAILGGLRKPLQRHGW